MGTITKIRQISPYVFIIFAVLFIVFMVLSDNISQIAGSGESLQTAAICEVNGEEILYRDFEERLKIRLEQMRTDPQNEGREIDEQYVRTQVWDELLREKLLQQAGDKFGITVSDDEVLDILMENPPDYLKSSFTDSTGYFNKDLYLQILTNPETLINHLGQDPTQIPQEQRDKYVADFRNQIIAITDFLKLQRLNESIAATVGAAYSVSSPSYITRKYIDENSNADMNYICVPIASIPDSLVKVTEEEMRAYYDKHKENFKVKNERRGKYIVFPVQPSAEDSSKNIKRLEKIQQELTAATTLEQKDSVFSIKLNEYAGTEYDWQMIQDMNPQITTAFATTQEREIVGPIYSSDGLHFYRLDGRRSGTNEVVNASHILISSNANKDSARTVAQELMKQVNTTNFAALAMERSDDKGSGAQGGDLGYFAKGRMVPEFEEAAFGAKTGAIVGPVESQFGYHIIYVKDKKSEELKYSEIIFQVSTSAATKNQIKRNAFAAMKQIEDGANIDSVAAKLKLSCQETPYTTKDRALFGSMYLTNQMFDSDIDAVFEPKEIYNGTQVIVLQLSNIRKAGIGSYEDDTMQIRQRLMKIKKLDMAKTRADEVYNVVRNNSTLLDTAAGTPLPHNLTVNTASIKNNGSIPGGPFDYPATVKAFELDAGKISAPIRADNGYYIFEIKQKVVPNEDTAKDAVDVMKQQYARTLFDTWFAKFKEDSDIKDYRSKFYSDY